MVQKRKSIALPPILSIMGPTASGKSYFALILSPALNGEIVNADSRQIYKYCSIGTSAPTSSEMKTRKHHLYHFIEPDHRFSAADYSTVALTTIATIHKKKKLPVLVGGSGLYLRALLEGLFPAPGQNPLLRETLKKTALLMGASFLHKQLRMIDPQAAQSILKNDLLRIIRAIEIYYLTGKPKSKFIKEQKPRKHYKLIKIGISISKSILFSNIEKRVDDMIGMGLIEETAFLMKHYPPDSPALNAIGYKEIILFLQHKITLPEAKQLINKNTKAYAKRQLVWFKKDADILWVSPHTCFDSDFINTLQLLFKAKRTIDPSRLKRWTTKQLFP